MFMSKLKLAIILISMTLPFIFLEKAGANEMNKLITKMCLKGFYLEMSVAKKNPKKHIGEYACNCFIEKISQGNRISTAQSLCKEEVSKKFNL